jgi:hypothetical protein
MVDKWEILDDEEVVDAEVSASEEVSIPLEKPAIEPEPVKAANVIGVSVNAQSVVRKAVEQSKVNVGNGWIKIRWTGGTRLVLPNSVRVKFVNGEGITKAKYWPMLQEMGVEFVEIDNTGYRELS